MNARLRSPAVTSATAMPRKQRGGSACASFSRMPEKMTSAKPKPTAAANEKNTLSKNGVPCLQLISAAPKTAQFVVMSGKKMPNAACKGGRKRFIAMSMNCTSAAMTRMNASVWM